MVCGADVVPVPGSFLPLRAEQVIRVAEPYLGLVECSSARLDYFETTNQWRARFAKRQRAQAVAEGPGSFLAT
jgi:hypothetical protein